MRFIGGVQQKPQNDKRAMGSWEKRVWNPSLLELQDVASLGSETSGVGPSLECAFLNRDLLSYFASFDSGGGS